MVAAWALTATIAPASGNSHQVDAVREGKTAPGDILAYLG
jgi:hypothetical protein